MERSKPLLPAALVGAGVASFCLWQWRRRRRTPQRALEEALQRLDLAHHAPFSKKGEAEYCKSVERWVLQLRKDAGEVASAALRLGARAQHLERGAIPRKSYPDGREGYLRWRAAVKKRQGDRITELLKEFENVLGGDCVNRVRGLVAKSLLLQPYKVSKQKSKECGDAEMQCIEDAACLVFLEEELHAGFPDGKDDAKMIDILQKTWKKMSRAAHVHALNLDYEPRMLGWIVEAIGQAEIADEIDPTSWQDVALPVPVPSQETISVLRETWAKMKGVCPCFGQAWYEELQLDPDYSSDLGLILDFGVCRPANISRLVELLIDLLCDTDKACPPRFASLLRAASLLASHHASFRLRHLDAMRSALVSTICKLVASNGDVQYSKQCKNAWESFGYVIGSQVAPSLLITDPFHDFCAAVAKPLPTPGAGPCAALLAAQGIALIEMSLHVLCKKNQFGLQMQLGDVTARDVIAQLSCLRHEALHDAQKDSHAYCGLLAAAIFDTAGGLEGRTERQARRLNWMRRCTIVPLNVAKGAIEAARLTLVMQACIKLEAPSVIGDFETGRELLLSASRVSLKTADLNIESSHGQLESEKDMSLKLADLHADLQQSLKG